jgi:hypothetical protein
MENTFSEKIEFAQMQRKKLQQFLTLKTRNGCCENGKINKIEK